MRRALTPLVTLLLTAVLAGAVAAAPPPVKNFLAIQDSAQERAVPGFEFVQSDARGVAIFRLSDDGESLSYQLIVANIENVTQAHIHMGARAVSGPVVVWLYPDTAPPAAAPGGGRIQGVIRQGTITEANLVGPLAGKDFGELLDAMLAGNTYVNVHTNDGVGDINTGAGDFPAGEIRGQIRGLGPAIGLGFATGPR